MDNNRYSLLRARQAAQQQYGETSMQQYPTQYYKNGAGAPGANVPGPICGACGGGPRGAAPAFMHWDPAELGDCPKDLSRWLCWVWKGLCNFNRFGFIGSVKLFTNTLDLPDPVNGFEIGHEGDATSLGVFFPRDWAAEASFHGIYRVKTSFRVQMAEENAGDLTPELIVRDLFDNLEFDIIQVGSKDNFHSAVNFGDAQDAERSTDTPSQGGFWFCPQGEFVPFMFVPEVYAFSFRGQAPGSDQQGDAYSVTATIQVYWKKVC